MTCCMAWLPVSAPSVFTKGRSWSRFQGSLRPRRERVFDCTVRAAGRLPRPNSRVIPASAGLLQSFYAWSAARERSFMVIVLRVNPCVLRPCCALILTSERENFTKRISQCQFNKHSLNNFHNSSFSLGRQVSILSKSHFLGAKLRALRKRNGMTLEELSARCVQRDTQIAPSVSYLSMIESGKRMPSQEVL